MSSPKNSTETKSSMSVMNAIQRRRSVRDYTSQTIERSVIHMLLDAAVHAPTARHEEPWSFTVIQD
jgi:nitroreductase